VAIAISAWFDTASEAVVRGLWNSMANAALDDSLHTGPYRPHITLGVWEELPTEAATAALTELSAQLSPLQVTFQIVGAFGARPAGECGVFLAPTVSRELRLLHERAHHGLRYAAQSPIAYYLPGNWNPHCTLAWRLAVECVPAAVDVAPKADVLPLSVTIDRIGVIDTPAEIELACFPLHGFD
jgi:2'-5' RNA ligase